MPTFIPPGGVRGSGAADDSGASQHVEEESQEEAIAVTCPYCRRTTHYTEEKIFAGVSDAQEDTGATG